MAEIYRTVVGNDTPALSITLKRSGTVIDLTTASSVAFIIKDPRTNTTLNTGHQTTTLATDKTSGVITYRPNAADIAVAGRYLGEADIHWADGGVETIYEVLIIVVRAA